MASLTRAKNFRIAGKYALAWSRTASTVDIIFSVDGHMVEPPDILDNRLPAKFADQAPKIIDTENGGQAWLWLDRVLPNVGLDAVVGRPQQELTLEPTRFEYMRPGTWNIHERVKDMDIDGFSVLICFSSFLPGFIGQSVILWPDAEKLALATMRAYNDWHRRPPQTESAVRLAR
jgi:hypothetical protein